MALSVNEHIGRRVAARRRAVGLTQRQVAQALGTTHQQVAKYESADTAISAERLWLLAAILRVEPAYFYGGLGPPSPLSGGPPPEKTNKKGHGATSADS